MIELYDKATNSYLGNISDEELQFLIDNLEEENLTDVDYYLDRDTIEMLKEKGMGSNLAGIIEKALGDNDSVEILYKKK
jgi:HEAT repeat protein